LFFTLIFILSKSVTDLLHLLNPGKDCPQYYCADPIRVGQCLPYFLVLKWEGQIICELTRRRKGDLSLLVSSKSSGGGSIQKVGRGEA